MKITIIADNYVDSPFLMAEHGFSCLIEVFDKKILFDTGQGGVLLNNMKYLNIPSKLDMLVFSHGHYDHTGGLTAYLEEVSGYTSEIYASKFIFDRHLKKTNAGNYSYIGFGNDRDELQEEFSLNLNSEITEISENIFLSGSINRYEEFDADKLLYADIDNDIKKDMFRDEQYLAVKTEEGIHIVTGCTHCGAVNLLKDVRDKFPGKKILSVTGGLHMFRSNADELDHVVNFLQNEDVKRVNTGHCTGIDAAVYMREKLGERVKITKAGMVFQL